MQLSWGKWQPKKTEINRGDGGEHQMVVFCSILLFSQQPFSRDIKNYQEHFFLPIAEPFWMPFAPFHSFTFNQSSM